jgi:antibiotic biosynthesis monooxygenase (ABM) superfamily enzyme
MAIKVLIKRRIRSGKENELREVMKELRSIAIRTIGYISGETLRSIEEPSLHGVSAHGKALKTGRVG